MKVTENFTNRIFFTELFILTRLRWWYGSVSLGNKLLDVEKHVSIKSEGKMLISQLIHDIVESYFLFFSML